MAIMRAGKAGEERDWEALSVLMLVGSAFICFGYGWLRFYTMGLADALTFWVLMPIFIIPALWIIIRPPTLSKEGKMQR